MLETVLWIFLGVIVGSITGIVTISLITSGKICLLYTSDAADEEDSVDLGGRRIIKKKNY